MIDMTISIAPEWVDVIQAELLVQQGQNVLLTAGVLDWETSVHITSYQSGLCVLSLPVR